MAQVRRIELAGLCCEPARQIRVADNGNTVANDNLICFGQFAISALFSGEIDNNAAILHRAHHVGRDQTRCRLARDQRRRNDDVDFLRLFGEQCHLGLDEFCAHGLGIAAFAGAVLIVIEIEHQELGVHALDLFFYLGSSIEGSHDRAHALGSANCRKPRNAGAYDEHLGRWNLACCCDLPGEKAAEVLCGLDDRSIAANVGHRTQCVHFLCSRYSRHTVHR